MLVLPSTRDTTEALEEEEQEEQDEVGTHTAPKRINANEWVYLVNIFTFLDIEHIGVNNLSPKTAGRQFCGAAAFDDTPSRLATSTPAYFLNDNPTTRSFDD